MKNKSEYCGCTFNGTPALRARCPAHRFDGMSDAEVGLTVFRELLARWKREDEERERLRVEVSKP
jgi:hypothetical protein